MSLLADIIKNKRKSWTSASKPGIALPGARLGARIAGTCLGLTLLAVMYGGGDKAFAASSITITVTDNAASLNLVAAEGNVAYGESDTASFTVTTTSSGGYTTTISGSNSDG